MLMLCLAACCSAAPRAAGPSLFFGPTANLTPKPVGANPLAQLVDGLVADEVQWSGLRAKLDASSGALHLRQMAIGAMNATQLRALAAATTEAGGGLSLSVEGGGALCGEGAGAKQAAAALKEFAPFIAAGGALTHWLLESVYSRTQAGCRAQSLLDTSAELAAFAAGISAGGLARANQSLAIFLYDALPHYAVGDAWPPNAPSHYDLELGATLRALVPAVAARGVALAGYWMDCPYEYSRDYPSASAPLPAGAGFEKIAAAVKLVKGMGLLVGKTFNSQQGGQTSAQAFFNGTMADAAGVAAALPSAASGGDGLDGMMVETWYSFPAVAVPETTKYTSAFTALAVFDKLLPELPGHK